MTRFVAAGFLIVVGIEVMAIALREHREVLSAASVAAAAVVLGVRWYLGRSDRAGRASVDDDAAKGLRRWVARTETLIERSESTRSDWDRHLRPMLARQFEMATGQRKLKNPRAFDTTGRVLFGDDLWRWVDPDNVSRTGRDEPGPGRDALNEILQRLERV